MEVTQEAEKDLRQEARRLLPLDTFEPEELEEMAGGAAPLILNGQFQYWQMGATVGVFTVSVMHDVWQLQVEHCPQVEAKGEPDEELKAVLRAFWDAEKPEYITAHSATDWPNIWLMQSAGFRQVGVLPLSVGPVISWGWRRCS